MPPTEKEAEVAEGRGKMARTIGSREGQWERHRESLWTG